jgi:sugar lactone lactonase YvrE
MIRHYLSYFWPKPSLRSAGFRGAAFVVAVGGLLGISLPSPAADIYHIAGAGFLTTEVDQVANLANPLGITMDGYVLTYVADTGNNIIYRLDPWAIAQILVGDGIPGFSGDGGTPESARVNQPHGLAMDHNFTLYIADTGNRRVRRVKVQEAMITTVAGSDRPGLTGLGGTATDAGLVEPVGLAADANGGFYIADAGANRVLYVNSQGTIQSFAGGGDSTAEDGVKPSDLKLERPVALEVGANGEVYIAEEAGKRIRMISSSGEVTTIADSKGKTGFALSSPRGLSMDQQTGNLYVSDGDRILLYSNGAISPYCGIGVPGFDGDNLELLKSPLNSPTGIVWDPIFFRLQITDPGNAFLRVAEEGLLKSFTRRGLGLEKDARNAKIVWPDSVAFDSKGLLLFNNTGHHLIWRVEPNPDYGGYSDVPETVVDTVLGSGRMEPKEGVPATQSGLNEPSGITTASDGSFYVSDRANHVVLKVGPDGIVSRAVGTGAAGYSGDGGAGRDAALHDPAGLVLDGEGNLFISDSGNHRIRRLDKSGILTTLAGNGASGSSGDGGAAISASLDTPTALALDGQGRLYVADTAANKVRRIALDGTIETVAGTGAPGNSGDGGAATSAMMLRPLGVWVDGDGSLFVSDSGNNRIRRVNSDGKIETVAGTGEPGNSGNQYEAKEAQIHEPAGLTANASGDLVFADRSNHQIRYLEKIAKPLRAVPAGPKAVSAPSAKVGDLNGDSRITIQDAIMALQLAVGLKKASAENLAVGDLNHDGRIDVSEAVRILRASVGLAQL